MSDAEELPSEEELEEEEEEDGEDSEEEEDDEDVEDDDDEEEEEEGDEKPRRPKKRQKAELPPPGREMPVRATRGLRMGALVRDAEEDQADEEFWNQEFFKEEEQDEIYSTESEPEDIADEDFSESEGEEEDEDEAEAAARAREPKKKVVRPPGYKKPPLPPRAKPAEGGTQGEPKAGFPRKRKSGADLDQVFERRMVRESTRQKLQEAEEERKLQEKLKPRRVVRHSNHRPLTQTELLAEAAKTEIENTKSLQLLQFIEEQTKKKAEVKKAKYAGPMLRFLSRAVDGQEQSMLEVRNMPTPKDLLPRTAPRPVTKPVCAITGLPAKYRDPRTGLPYANLEAYKVLQQRMHGMGQQTQQAVQPALHAQQVLQQWHSLPQYPPEALKQQQQAW